MSVDPDDDKLSAYDATTLHVARWAASLTARDVTADDAYALTWHHIDSVGCAIGAVEAEPCRALRRLAATGRSPYGISVVAMPEKVSAELGTLANTSMLRYLDYNDNYLRLGGGHTSDLIPALWAAAEATNASGLRLLVGLHAGYEAFAALADAVPLRERGWDYPLFIGIAAAVGTSVVLGLSVEQTANAIAMAVTPAVPLGITRAGQLSNWKGLAAPFSTMTGLLAARLAAEGITGPPQSIEGVRGLWALVTGEFSLDALGAPQNGQSAAQRSAYKLNVAEFNSQGPVYEFIKLHHKGLRPEQIERISIGTYYVAWSEIGGGQDDHDDKWDPRNRETADHSLPYMCAVALVDGQLQADSYRPERFLDPALRPLMSKIEVVEDPAITATWVEVPAHDISIRLTDGSTKRVRVDYPRGHPGNPATPAELEHKFREQVSPVAGEPATQELLTLMQDLAGQPDLSALFDRLRAIPSPSA